MAAQGPEVPEILKTPLYGKRFFTEIMRCPKLLVAKMPTE